MSNVIKIFASITTILFSIIQGDIIYTVKKRQNIGIKNTSSFSITSCLIDQFMLFLYLLHSQKDFLVWFLLAGVIISFMWDGTYLYYYYKDNKKAKFYHFIMYIFAIADLIFEIWLIEDDLLKDEENEEEGIKRKYIIGVISIFNILMYINPGLNIFKFLIEMDYGYISLPIITIGLINSIFWLLFAIVDEFYWIYICSNIIGILIGLIQLFLYIYIKLIRKKESIIYSDSLLPNHTLTGKNKKKTKKNKRKISDEEKKKDILDDSFNFV
jgi:hypothetical protein